MTLSLALAGRARARGGCGKKERAAAAWGLGVVANTRGVWRAFVIAAALVREQCHHLTEMIECLRHFLVPAVVQLHRSRSLALERRCFRIRAYSQVVLLARLEARCDEAETVGEGVDLISHRKPGGRKILERKQ